jgi:hypothetical protein
MSTSRLLIGFMVFCLACAIAPVVLADGSQTGTLEGRVLDAQGSPLPGVTISLTGPQGQASTVTDDGGRFRFGLLIDGDYTVAASLEGLGSTELKVPVSAGGLRSVDLVLRSATTETITVTSEAPLVNKYETSAAATLENEVSENLSFVGRNVQSSLEVLPGVVHTATSRQQGGIQASVNGGQWQENAGLVDGVDTSFARRGGGSRIFLPTTSLTGTTMESAGFSAEYGRVVSGVTQSVIKSGTNQFHGDFLWIPQNAKWKAEYDALDIPREDDLINSFETSLGGPIVRDKAWFFASYGNMDTNELDLLADGSVVDVGFKTDAKILKLNFQPTGKHQIQLTGVDAPMDKLNTNVNSGDKYTPCDCLLDENLATGTWSYAATNSAFIEAKLATQQDRNDRDAALFRTVVPGASPDSPLGNTFKYQDQSTGLQYNAITQGAGLGYIDTNRNQGNASLSLFRGAHDLKFGFDYQDVSSETLNIVGALFRGQGYNENLPGGFLRPQDKRVFDPSNAVESTSDVYSAYAQDRFDLSERFNLYLGVRMDNQAFDNDAGQEIISSTDFAPRLAATYDTKGDGTFLIKATAGRYYQVVGQDIFNREFATLPNGQNQSTLFRWNANTQRYDIFGSRTLLSGLDTGTFDPYYKDEVSAGVEWQFVPAWAFKARAIWWEVGDTFWSTNQFNAAGQVVSDVRNWDDGFREYQGAVFELNRAFRDGWTVRTNYTYSDGDGNTFGTGDGTTDADTLFELLGGLEVCTASSAPGCTPGSTDATIRHREGSGNTEREHILNLVGLKNLELGSTTLTLGGYFGFRSGEPWGLRAPTSLRHPVSGISQSTTTYVTDRDANQMEDTYTLNLSGYWQFPISGRFEGRVGVEAVNVTNEQEVISINLTTGQPDAGKTAIQSPREYRFQVGLTF